MLAFFLRRRRLQADAERERQDALAEFAGLDSAGLEPEDELDAPLLVESGQKLY